MRPACNTCPPAGATQPILCCSVCEERTRSVQITMVHPGLWPLGETKITVALSPTLSAYKNVFWARANPRDVGLRNMLDRLFRQRNCNMRVCKPQCCDWQCDELSGISP